MAVRILWTKRAEQGYDSIIDYIAKAWTEKEVGDFIRETTRFFELLKENPRMLEQSHSRRNLHRGSINRLTILTYRYKPRKKEIVLVNVRSARKKPLK